MITFRLFALLYTSQARLGPTKPNQTEPKRTSAAGLIHAHPTGSHHEGTQVYGARASDTFASVPNYRLSLVFVSSRLLGGPTKAKLVALDEPASEKGSKQCAIAHIMSPANQRDEGQVACLGNNS